MTSFPNLTKPVTGLTQLTSVRSHLHGDFHLPTSFSPHLTNLKSSQLGSYSNLT